MAVSAYAAAFSDSFAPELMSFLPGSIIDSRSHRISIKAFSYSSSDLCAFNRNYLRTFQHQRSMDNNYDYDSEGSAGWEILPIWLYLVGPSPREREQKYAYAIQTAALSAYDALMAFIPSRSKRVLFNRYPSCAWQERTSLAARQFGALNLLLTVLRVHSGLSIHEYGAYNAGVCSALILLVHFVGERMAGSIRGSALSAAEVATFITFVWMMVQREKYVRKSLLSLMCALLSLHADFSRRRQFALGWRRNAFDAPSPWRSTLP